MLDNAYARNHSFWKDIRLILRTIPALFQKESV
jgi:lipopolysaccharide/colanic/teichoic acid biosynthesis glycosyltransferase